MYSPSTNAKPHCAFRKVHFADVLTRKDLFVERRIESNHQRLVQDADAHLVIDEKTNPAEHAFSFKSGTGGFKSRSDALFKNRIVHCFHVLRFQPRLVSPRFLR
ncbi:MAG TPA: hypothetical protein PKM58_02995 [Pyrinomonadaceae bacterium]|nr:hypothetical protein [Pyrinomonadaceae bacterium]